MDPSKGQRGLVLWILGGLAAVGVSHLLLLCERDDLIGKRFVE